MKDAGLFLDANAELPPAEESLDAFLASFTEERLVSLRSAYFLDNGIYSMKTPFRNYAAAQRYFEDGIAFAPDEWRLWANYGALSLLMNERERALEQLRRAAELKGATLDAAGDRVAVPYLMEATFRAGVDLTALSDG